MKNKRSHPHFSAEKWRVLGVLGIFLARCRGVGGGGGGLISLFIASMIVYSEFQFLRGIVHFLSLSCTVFPRRAYNRTEDDSVSPKTKH